MPFVGMTWHAALVGPLTRAAFMHHADPEGVYQPHRVGMMHDCSNGELLARAAFMHHDDHRALKPYAALKGLKTIYLWWSIDQSIGGISDTPGEV